MTPIEAIVLVVGIVTVLYSAYRGIRYFMPSWGTLLTNGLVVVAGLAEMLGTLPWNLILNKDYQGAVMMGIAIVNALMRLTPSPGDPPMMLPK